MSLKKVSKEQPDKFEFSKKNSFKLSNWKKEERSYGAALFSAKTK
jgi:hypothetical protein